MAILEPNIDTVPQTEAQAASYGGSVAVGKDILELLGSSMYVNPLTIYREYIQNAVDSIDDAVKSGKLSSSSEGKIDIALDHIGRRAVVRDNGTGIEADEFAARMTAFGASKKRGTDARGFRGVGRLAGMGYCQELVFRSRTNRSSKICEVRWDCKSLKRLQSDQSFEGNLEDVVREIVSVREYTDVDCSDRFFEVEIVKPKRLGNDLLLNELAIENYISQVGPCPLSPSFSFGPKIRELLQPSNVKEYDVFLNEGSSPIYRPYSDTIEYSDSKSGHANNIQTISIEGVDGDQAAVGWILHHDYQGALPSSLGIRGLRSRVGNIQVGNERIFSEVFPEERFCSWTIGELHILDNRILPNGRRDNFEPNTHLSNVVTHLLPYASEVARECRTSSQLRNRIKTFELEEQKAVEKIEILEQGAITKTLTKILKKELGSHLAEMKRSTNFDLISDQNQIELYARTTGLEDRLDALTGLADSTDPIENLPKSKRGVYREIFDLIYEASANRTVAKTLIDKIISRITVP